MTYHNQNEIIITRVKAESSFISVSKADLLLASQLLTPAQTLVYLDLIGYSAGFKLAFSPAYYKQHYGISEQTARTAYKRLLELGYLYEDQGIIYFRCKPDQQKLLQK